MADPLRPSRMTKMRAKLGKERDATLLEALRSAGRAAYPELLAADQRTTTATHRLAAGNAFVLQTLGEHLLDADYSTHPGTVGFVPPAVYDQAAQWLSAVEGWLSRAGQARANPDYDISRDLAVPARLPWVETGRGLNPPERLTALLAAVGPIRNHVEVALFRLENPDLAYVRRPAVHRLRQFAAEAAAATDYAIGLHARPHHPILHQLIDNNLRRAVELWFHTGQLAVMPHLLEEPGGPSLP